MKRRLYAGFRELVKLFQHRLIYILCLIGLMALFTPQSYAASSAQTNVVGEVLQLPASVFGVEMLSVTSDGGLDYLTATQSAWVRGINIFWSDVESVQGEYDWSKLDDVAQEFQNARDSGLTPIVVVRGTPPWAQPEGWDVTTCGPMAPEFLDDFTNFITATMTLPESPLSSFDIQVWEIWNEPDIDPEDVGADNWWGGCWGDKNETYYGGEYYGEMLSYVTPAIKSVNPDATVMVGGLLLDCDPYNPPPDPVTGDPRDCSPANFLEGILVAGGAPYFDGVSFHAYDYYGVGREEGLGMFSNPNWNSQWDTTGPVSLAKAHFLEDVLKKYGLTDKFLMNTESSLLCDTCADDPTFEATKAYYLAQAYSAAIAEGWTANIWFTLVHSWRYNGLLEGGLIPLPAYDAYQFASQELSDADYVRAIHEYGAGVAGYEFQLSDRNVWLLWSRDGVDHPVLLPATPQHIYNVYGEEQPASTSLIVTLEPVYAELPAMLPRLRLPMVQNLYQQYPFENGNFEQGFDHWEVINQGLPATLVTSNPPGEPDIPRGAQSSLLGNPSYPCNGVPLGYAAVRQKFTVPFAPGAVIKMDFAYVVYSQDASTRPELDAFEAYLTVGSTTTKVFSDGNQNSAQTSCAKWWRIPGVENPRNGQISGWGVGSIDLTPYLGQTITVSFQNHSRLDNWYNTYTYLDSVEIIVEP